MTARDTVKLAAESELQLVADYDAARTTIAGLNTQLTAVQTELAACKNTLPPPLPSSPSGEQAPIGNLPGWRQIFGDDFPTNVPLGSFPAAVSAKWVAYPTTYDDTSNNGIYDAGRTISIANSVMQIRMHTSVDGVVRVAAPVPLIRPRTTGVLWPGQLYGRYAVRVCFPDLMPGFKVAWLLWPDKGTNTTGSPDGVGGNGEIDGPEHDLNQQAKTSAFMHRQNATVGNDQYGCSINTDLSKWHTFVTEWSPNLCRFLCDGVEYGRTTESVPKTSMHYVMQCETALSGKPAANVAGRILVDWVAIYAYAPGT